ncbi:MAG: hypothetical protein KGZ83_18510 [Sulfuricella sp.]|nr:hypothetical protein [Sulfuricella sp.]
MSDHDNLPVMVWEGKSSVLRARTLIMRREPLILEMSKSFGIDVDAGECGCRTVDNGRHFLGCDPKCTLSLLADTNHLPALASLGDAAEQAGLLVDLDRALARIIIYN